MLTWLMIKKIYNMIAHVSIKLNTIICAVNRRIISDNRMITIFPSSQTYFRDALFAHVSSEQIMIFLSSSAKWKNDLSMPIRYLRAHQFNGSSSRESTKMKLMTSWPPNLMNTRETSRDVSSITCSRSRSA